MKRKLRTNKIVMVLLLCMISSWHAFGQDLEIQGKVTDSYTGEALPGVNIAIKGTNKGTVANNEGVYNISAPKGAILSFSYVGYKKFEIEVGSSLVINVILENDVQQLQELVVIGYGTVKKTDATGSVNVVSAGDFNKGGAITSAQDLLIGKSAGVVITTSNGAPGSGSTIRVRGGSSLNASNDPLIIVDGVPLDNNDVSGSANFLAFINPNDIESFTVLKDASASAIYGSRASNGVILIATKKGKVGGAMKVSYNENTSIASAIKFIDVYSGDELRQIAYEHKSLYGADSFDKLGTASTDWQKQIFHTSISQDHSLSVSGAYKTLPYRVSVGYTGQNGIMKNTDLQRFTGSISLDPSFLNDNLKININAKGMTTNNNFGDAGALGSAIAMDPTQVVKDGNTNSDGYFQWSNYGASLGTPNPVEQALATDNKSTVKRGIGNIQFNYKLPYITDLHANLNLATDYTTSTGHNNLPTTAPSNLANGWGKLTDFHAKNYNNLLDFFLNYTKDFSQVSSKIDLTGGYSWQHFKRKGDNYSRGFQDDTHPYSMTDSTAFITESYLVSFFGRLNYSLMDKYLLTFTVRDDGSSRFAKNNRWGLFPSAALAWKIKDEPFLKDVNAVSSLKLRLGWGVTGQQDVGNDYPAQSKYISSVVGAYYYFDGAYISTLRPNAYDPNIKWEHTNTQNIGLDFGFLKERITGSVDVYNRVTDDLLNTVTIPSGSNFSNTLLTNVGSLENKGVEFSLSLVPILTKDASLTLGLNVTYNKNKVTKLLATDDATYIGALEGGDSYTGSLQVTQVGSPAHSFFMNKQVYDASGNPIEGLYVDLSGKGGAVSGTNADKYICHNPFPDYLMGFNVRFNYKNLDISASTRASIGNYVYNQVASGASYDQMYQIGYWHNEPKYLSDTKFVKRQYTSDYFVQNASFFKLDNISAGYRFNNIYNKLGLRVSFTIQNLMTITKYKGMDPEVGYNNSEYGVDNNYYPRPRTFMLGISLNY
jgi:TonB-dependent starch-binding outer membrane protein SusC